jgi:TPR repeat protein
MVASQLPLTPGHESTLEIRVTPESAIPPRALIVIKGAPTGVRVSERRALGAGVWVVPAAHLTILKLIAAKDYRGGGVISVALATLDGNAIAETMVTLVNGPQAGVPVNAPAAPPTGTITASPPTASERGLNPQPKMTTEKRTELLLLLQKGMESLRIGNILHARQFFLRAAENGSAEAALALAATYDPVELGRMAEMTRVVPDPALARKWYEKAKELGSSEAEARLAALARR